MSQPSAKGPRTAPPTCCGVIEEAAYRSREKRAARTKPQPWIVRKLMVAFTLGIMGYSAYVFVGRLCVDMIRRRDGVGGSRGTGIALLVVFSILFLWMMWAYVKVICTSPGYAKDYTPKCDRPPNPEPQPFTPYDHDVEGIRYSHSRPSHSHAPSRDTDRESIGGPSYENIPARAPTNAPESSLNANLNSNGVGKGTRDTNNIPTQPTPTYGREKSPAEYISRRPPKTPILCPHHRYCAIDEIVKPYRTHHCRSCGTCILKYDHHCPWIGQCVGARNHKFFLNFVQAASVYAVYVCVVFIIFLARAVNSPNGTLDPQWIVIIALSGIFGLFTTLLQVTHIRLICLGQTTVESMMARSMRHREDRTMSDVLGTCAILGKRRTRRRWDAEWGRIDQEGNIWWLGSGMEGWKDVMGRNPWGWFCESLLILLGLSNSCSCPFSWFLSGSTGSWSIHTDRMIRLAYARSIASCPAASNSFCGDGGNLHLGRYQWSRYRGTDESAYTPYVLVTVDVVFFPITCRRRCSVRTSCVHVPRSQGEWCPGLPGGSCLLVCTRWPVSIVQGAALWGDSICTLQRGFTRSLRG
ncbi:DHHC palmitoyltransferase-domain-containing protein [Lyophyllum atratum]|nr:DHHC palmitoyltransferase-domain-containing protein [Lyophyllum atratum]